MQYACSKISRFSWILSTLKLSAGHPEDKRRLVSNALGERLACGNGGPNPRTRACDHQHVVNVACRDFINLFFNLRSLAAGTGIRTHGKGSTDQTWLVGVEIAT